MAAVAASVKRGILKLGKIELEKLVLKAASMNKEFHDYLLVNVINKDDGGRIRFEAAKSDLAVLMNKQYRGRSEELRLAEMLIACNKKVVAFSKVCKDKKLELDLIADVLAFTFAHRACRFGTCFTKFDYQVYLLVKKAVTIFNTKLQREYKNESAGIINQFLRQLHERCSHLDYVYDMPNEVIWEESSL